MNKLIYTGRNNKKTMIAVERAIQDMMLNPNRKGLSYSARPEKMFQLMERLGRPFITYADHETRTLHFINGSTFIFRRPGEME